ncbi:MAG: HlyD family efflux transporter periplasmic adaptor subunit [Acidobacteria bacterium]|nr:HlyD family efflux transporter periplasmic adaptor subunit [Acidobacteriota bacterium]
MDTQNKHKKAARAVVALTVLSLTGFSVWWFFLRAPQTAKEIIALSGRIESDDAAVAAKTSGRIRTITVREGDAVKAGQVIAVIDDEQIKAREDAAQSAVTQAEAKVLQAQQQISVLQAQLEQSRLTVTQSRADAEGRVSQAQAHVAAAEASLARAQADYDQARYDKEKFTTLAEQGDVSEREGRQAVTAAETNKAVVLAAQRQVEAARGALVAAKANLDNPAIRSAEAAAIEQQIRQAQSAVASAQAEVARERAKLEEARTNRRDLEITAPIDGTVATRSAEPGEVVAAGAPIVTLVNFNQVYLRGFIPEGEIGRVRTGQPARVYLDSNPHHPMEATVARIDPQASFTPENTYFRDDRVKQVVGVKLLLTSPQGFAKPGMPADGEVLVEGHQWLASTRRED